MRAELLSYIYRKVRGQIIDHVYKKQDSEERPRDLEEVVEIGEKWLNRLPRFTHEFAIPDGIGAKLYDLEFPSPLTLAAFKDDMKVIDIWMRLGLGGACIKTVMRDERKGNQRPRLQECTYDGHECLINALGLPGPGRDETISRLHTSGLFRHRRPIGISIGGSTINEYKTNFDQIERNLTDPSPYRVNPLTPRYYFEVNISCPNTPDGQNMLKNPGLLNDLLKYMRENTSAVIAVKLSPDMTNNDLIEYIRLVNQHGKTAVNLGNTQRKTCAQAGLPNGAISVGAGGLSGPALYQRTLEMVKLAAPIGLPIIATGGVDSAWKVIKLLESGASIVGMATAVVKDMYCVPRINMELKNRLKAAFDGF